MITRDVTVRQEQQQQQQQPYRVAQEQEAMVLRDELNRFCHQTSMKGVPRIVKSDYRPLRFAWVFFVLALLSVCIWQVTTLGVSYFAYPMTTTVREKMLYQGEEPYFPAVTICNHNTVSTKEQRKHRIPSQEEYQALVLRETECPHCSDVEREQLSNLTNTLLSSTGYFQYLGVQNATLVGHQKDGFVIHCHMSVQIGVSLKKQSCDEIVTVSRVVYTKRFNCYKFSLPSTLTYNVHGITLMMYLENTHQTTYAGVYNPYASGKGAGAKLVLNDLSDPFPFPDLEGVDIAAGVSSQIGVSLEHKLRMGQPYGDCEELQNNETTTMLAGLCFLKRVYEKCDCIDADSPFPITLYKELPKDAQFCQSINSLTVAEIQANTKCIDDAKLDTMLECFGDNRLACSEMNYKTVVSQSTWPLAAEIPEFLHFVRKKIPDIGDVLPKQGDGCNSSSETVNNQEMLNFVQDNFLKVSIVVTDFKYTELRQVPKYILSELCSQIGGILNLWSGITVVLLLELAEFAFRLCYSVSSPTDNNTKSTPDTNHISMTMNDRAQAHCPKPCPVHCPGKSTENCSQCHYHCPCTAHIA